MQSTSEWLHSLGLGQYSQVFADSDIDLEVLASLSEQDLEKLGVASMGHRKKLLKAISRLGETVATAPAAAPSPREYTPSHLADRILRSRSAMEGERKQVTVLFADLKGSMELLADRDPEEARSILDPVLERMMEAVHRYEGTVNQVMGDGIMALFGAPLALEDHALRACYAALRMQESVKRYALEVLHSHGLTVRIRVGINSGEVVVRSIGNDLHMDYTAVGQTTHLAARMEQLADPGRSLITATTLQLAEGFIEAIGRGPVAVKGLSEPVEIFELVGAGTARTRLQASASRGLTKLAGRVAELTRMFAALDCAHAGQGQVVALVGEPGVGKSRLEWEFIHSHRTQGWLVLESGAVSYGKASAYGPVIDLLKGYFQIEERDDARRIQEKVSGRLLALDPSFSHHLVAVLALLDATFEDKKWSALDPAQRRMRMLDACKRLILREAQVQPLVLVVEDLHWIDSETQTLLDQLVESLPAARILLLVNFRPEYQSRWGAKPYYTELRIDPLSGESAEEIVQTLLGADSTLRPLGRLLIERTQGNPLFLEESVRTLVETGALQGEPGGYRLAAALDSIRVPATVQAILAARIDRLSPDDKQLLQAAAVIGKDVPYSLLQTIAELSEERLRQRLAALQAAEFIYEKSLFPDLEYTFKHALTHEVAYGGVLNERRKTLHAQIVASIERLYADRLADQVERLAHHALRGEAWEKAVRYSREAGMRALDRSAAHEALVHFEQARAALQRLPESEVRTEQRIDLCFERRNALFPLGEFGRVGAVLNEAHALAEGLRDQRRLGWILAYKANLYAVLGDHAQAVEAGERACAIAAAAWDQGLRVVAQYYLGLALWYAGDPPRAAKSLQAAIALAGEPPAGERFGLPPIVPAVIARWFLAAVLGELGEFEEALSVGKEGLGVAQTVGHANSEIWARHGLGYAHLRQGDFAAAVTVLEAGLALCRITENRLVLPFVAGFLGCAYLGSGRAHDALRVLQEAVEASKAMRMVGFRSLFIASLAETYLVLGRLAEAREHAEEALALARAHRERAREAWSLKVLGDIRAQELAGANHARDAYRGALALAAEVDMRPLQALCHFALGELANRSGEPAEASDHFRTAASMFREMGMQFWLSRAGPALEHTGAAQP